MRLARFQAAERAGSRRAGYAFTVAGTVVGPVLGVWMSLVAADATHVGIAQTLLSQEPPPHIRQVAAPFHACQHFFFSHARGLPFF